MIHATFGPVWPHSQTTIVIIDNEAKPVLVLGIDEAARLVDDLAGLVAAAVRPSGDEVLARCIDLGIPRGGNGQRNEAGQPPEGEAEASR